jgi:hypothetical protein
MTDTKIQDTIRALEEQEAAIADEFQRLEARLAQVRTAKAALIALESDEPMEFDGNLADACRRVLQAAGRRSLSPTEVRDAVKALGYDITKHTNVMAAIHSVLKRLAETPEVDTKELKQAPGQRRYYWVANFAEPMPFNNSIESANIVNQHHRAIRDRHRVAMTSNQTMITDALLFGEQPKRENKK